MYQITSQYRHSDNIDSVSDTRDSFPHDTQSAEQGVLMALVGRMREWREAQRRKAGGMTQLTVWVPARAAEYLKGIFARLADTGERGEDYRRVVNRWRSRRRVQAEIYNGAGLGAEIDLPYLGPFWHLRPAGGRIIGTAKTWIELTPDEANDVSILCRRSVTTALAKWLKERDLQGKKRDHTGVALGRDFCQPDYQPDEDESIIRPRDDDDFEKNEAAIAQEVERAALQSTRHPTEDPSVVYYPGFHGIPSRCHVVHRRDGNRVLFALGHIEHGGTSPTNMIENLAVWMHRRFYPDVQFDHITWFDAWPAHDSLTNKFHIQRVVFADSKIAADPMWVPARDVPADFVEEIRNTISLKPAAAPTAAQ
jgi:hypothetical protein